MSLKQKVQDEKSKLLLKALEEEPSKIRPLYQLNPFDGNIIWRTVNCDDCICLRSIKEIEICIRGKAWVVVEIPLHRRLWKCRKNRFTPKETKEEELEE